MDPEEIRTLIEAGLETERVEVSGDGRHFDALVVSPAFDGRSILQQHRMVYATLGDRFDTEVLHALALKTYTPQQWRDLGA
jgi:acid stress-induced BolA-like protein IbaG/YrbA